MHARPDRATAQLDDDHRFVYAVARRIVGDRDAASDVAQDAMLQAFRHRASFRGDARYRTWLYRIATTAAFSHLRRERSLARRAAGHAAAGPVAPPPTTPLEALAAAETARVVTEQVGALADRYREILALRFYDDCTEREAAATLGVSEAAIKLRTHRAKRALRARLADGHGATGASRSVTPSQRSHARASSTTGA